MKIEVGKFYKTRDGDFVKIVAIKDHEKHTFPVVGRFSGQDREYLWTKDGFFYGADSEDEYDLVSEWMNPTGENPQWTAEEMAAIAANEALSDAPLAINTIRCLLPEDSYARKLIPVTTGVLDYFPLAIAAVAELSKLGNDKHNPGEPLHWARGKSTDHADCIGRHLIDRGRFAEDGTRHTAALAWRALAMLQEELEAERGLGPVSR